jgi:phosphate transport system substrate-binding protein
MKDSLWLVITTRDYKANELEYLKAQKQFPLSIRMAYDGLAFVQNSQNTDSCISVKDIRRILKGEVKRWDEIYPGSKLGEISIVFDNKKSSTVHYVEDSILGGKPITAPGAFAVDSTSEVVDYVEKHKEAIGLIGSNWLNDRRDTTNLTFRRGIRPMAVSSVDVANNKNSYKPYQYYFYNGSYPFTRTLYILLNDTNAHGLPTGFKNFIISQNEGQMVVLKAGLLPAYGNITFRSVHINKE